MTHQHISCAEHGQAFATFVCEHLVGASGVGWYSAAPDAENRWPDAWCGKCQEAYAAEGEWNERSEAAARLKAALLCHHCYEAARSRCTAHPV